MRIPDECVCSTFGFQGLRIDEALRLYLEAFRLPGEAPVIQRLLETFTDNWHVRRPGPYHTPQTLCRSLEISHCVCVSAESQRLSIHEQRCWIRPGLCYHHAEHRPTQPQRPQAEHPHDCGGEYRPSTPPSLHTCSRSSSGCVCVLFWCL